MKPEKRNNRRHLIIDTAAELFGRQGYDRTSVRDLAEGVGMQSGSLFYHFKSKEEILVAVIESGIRRGTELLEAKVAVAETPQDVLRAFMESHLQMLHAGAPNNLLLFGAEWHLLQEESRAQLVEKADAYEAYLNQLLADVAAAGVIPAHNIKVLRLFLLGALNWTTQWYKPGDGLEIEELAALFASFLSGSDSGESANS